jgi:hypothetical protein
LYQLEVVILKSHCPFAATSAFDVTISYVVSTSRIDLPLLLSLYKSLQNRFLSAMSLDHSQPVNYGPRTDSLSSHMKICWYMHGH